MEAKKEIISKVRRIFANKHFSYCKFPEEKCTCERAEINEDTDLIEAGYVDSFNVVVLQAMIERIFKIKLSDKLTPEDFRTVNDMIKLIER